MNVKQPSIEVHQGDLPPGLDFGDSVAVDTETLGLRPERDRLCVVQLSKGENDAHLVQLAKDSYDAPNLKALLGDASVTKLYHFARFDLGCLRRYLGVVAEPVYCTKIASRLVRTYTDQHGLKDLCRELLGVTLSKEQQSSDWAADSLSPEQINYAAADVLHLHDLRAKLDAMLARDGRSGLARACFEGLGLRVELDMRGWADQDIFAH